NHLSFTQETSSPADLATDAGAAKKRKDTVNYLRQLDQAAQAYWKQLPNSKVPPPEGAKIVAAALAWPAENEARFDCPGSLIALRLSLLKALCSKQVPLGALPADQAREARQKLAGAALDFVRAVSDAASQATTKKAEAELLAAKRAIADLP